MNGNAQSICKTRSLASDALRDFSRNRAGVAGGIAFVLLVFVAIFAPILVPYNPLAAAPPEAFQPPSLRHIMGTDEFGRDIFSRILCGTIISLQMGVFSALVAAIFGLAIGLIGGYIGGWVDTVIMRIADIMLAVPSQLTALAIVAGLGPSIYNVMLAVGVVGIARFVRLVRSCVISAKQNLYVDAARVIGCSDFRIAFRHLLPNVFAPALVQATIYVSGAILLGAAFSFLGMGAQPPTPEWGLMLSKGRRFMRDCWWITFFPGVAIVITVLSVNMVGDALRDAFDPKLKGGS